MRAEVLGRNAPCSCGSGLKFKRCCGGEPVVRRDARASRLFLGGIALVVLFGAGATALMLARSPDASSAAQASSQVWSEEHGHWHNVRGQPPTQPLIPGVEGKVWSEEHGHWHNAPWTGPLPPSEPVSH